MSPAVRSTASRVLLGCLAVGVVATLVVFNPFRQLRDDDADASATREQGEITVATLTRTIEVDGELVYTEQRSTAPGQDGTLTALAEVGQAIPAATAVYEIDGRPTVALVGGTPAWRTMTVDDDGPDVLQLETNLAALGYDPEGELSVDTTFTEYTAVVVERWQEDLGLEPTGRVEVDSVVFVPDSAEVVDVASSDGSGQPVLTIASQQRVVTFTVAAAERTTIEVGTTVSARLPDRRVLDAIVTDLSPTGDGSWTATADLRPVGEEEGQVLPDGLAVPITVWWTETTATDALTVRANALTRVDGGGYVLEVLGDDDSTRFVEVDVIGRSGSTIEIATDLPPGTPIIAP